MILMYSYLIASILKSYFVSRDFELFRILHFNYFVANTSKFWVIYVILILDITVIQHWFLQIFLS